MNQAKAGSQTKWIIWLALALIVAYFGIFGRGSGLKGKSPPPLSSTGTWLNSETLSWAALRGKVVWLEFSFLH